MSEIKLNTDIRFDERFKEVMLNGEKTCTTRIRRIAEPGEIFEAFGAFFRVESLEYRMLHHVAHKLYRREGFLSAISFKYYWVMVYPQVGYDPKKIVIVINFKRYGETPQKKGSPETANPFVAKKAGILAR